MKNKFDKSEFGKEIISRMSHEQKQILDIANNFKKPLTKIIPITSNGFQQNIKTTRVGCGPLITPFGPLWMIKFDVQDTWKEYNVLIRNDGFDVKHVIPNFIKDELILRIDSGCSTGQLFHDLTCECHEQLHMAMKEINHNGEGMIIHIPSQDGRGKGVPFKLSTLYLQKELKLDTIEAAAVIDNPIDVRTYEGVVAILKFININLKTPINLATNNPDKKRILEENSFNVIQKPVIVCPTEFTELHLKAKEKHLGHTLSTIKTEEKPR
jgi:GTP cyclohydrolase II